MDDPTDKMFRSCLLLLHAKLTCCIWSKGSKKCKNKKKTLIRKIETSLLNELQLLAIQKKNASENFHGRGCCSWPQTIFNIIHSIETNNGCYHLHIFIYFFFSVQQVFHLVLCKLSTICRKYFFFESYALHWTLRDHCFEYWAWLPLFSKRFSLSLINIKKL